MKNYEIRQLIKQLEDASLSDELAKTALEFINQLAKQKMALMDMCLNYASCHEGCPFPGSGAEGKEPEECICGWVEAHNNLTKILFGRED